LSYIDLREWIAALDRAGELKRIRTEVDPILEIAEIADRVSKGAAKKYGRPGGPALLFENVKGANGVPVLINQFGSERRMQMALGVDSLDEIADRIRQLLNMKSPEGFLEKLKMLAHARRYGQVFPQNRPHRPLQRSHQEGKLFPPRLSHPAMLAAGWRTLHHSALRHHPAIQKQGSANTGMYRIQIYDATHPPACTGNARKLRPSITATCCAQALPLQETASLLVRAKLVRHSRPRLCALG